MATTPASNALALKYSAWAADPKNEAVLARDNCTVISEDPKNGMPVFAFYGHGSSQFANWASNWSNHSVADTNGDVVATLPDGTELKSSGQNFYTSEHAMMWYKAMAFDADNYGLLQSILSSKSPNTVKKLGRKVANYKNDVWAAIRLQVMVHILRQKAAQHPEIANDLRDSRGLYIMEASKYDKIWGVGMYAKEVVSALTSGLLTISAIEANPQCNLLGKAWMKIRDEL